MSNKIDESVFILTGVLAETRPPLTDEQLIGLLQATEQAGSTINVRVLRLVGEVRNARRDNDRLKAAIQRFVDYAEGRGTGGYAENVERLKVTLECIEEIEAQEQHPPAAAVPAVGSVGDGAGGGSGRGEE